MPGTLPEMRTPDYWIARMSHPDEVVLTLGQIQQMNKNYSNRMAHLERLDSNANKEVSGQLREWVGLLAALPDISEMSPSQLSTWVSDKIQAETDFLKKGRFGNILGIGYSVEEVDKFSEEMAPDRIGHNLHAVEGLIVKDARLRIIPSLNQENIGLTNNTSRWDMWNLDILPVGSLVHVLHASRTGGFLFVLSERGYGWVRSEKVAFGKKADLEQFSNDDNFLLCTGDKVPFYADQQCTYVSGWFSMGDHLPAVAGSGRQVKVPVRRINGGFAVETAWLAPDADVHKGYLPYTRKNVVVEALKLLDNIYDWTGGWYGRNHVTDLRDIFGCFGFTLPANGVLLSFFNTDSRKLLRPDQGQQVQYQTISANPPFLTLQMVSSGHSQLYLGDYNGVPIVFDTHGYSYKDDQGRDLVVRRCVIGTISLPNYFLKQDISFVTLK
jgi:hypothetical protein